jgi:hypothetical protein
MYAQQNRGYFPQMVWDTPENLPREVSQIPASSGLPMEAREYGDVVSALYRIVNRRDPEAGTAYTAGGMNIFYCPSNFFWDGDTAGTGSSHWPADLMTAGKIKYWYFGNPNGYYPRFHYTGGFNPDGSPASTGGLDWRFWDTNKSGDNRDEYIVKNNDSKPAEKLLMTDQSRQNSGANQWGFQFVHGPRRSPIQGWKNNLYGDGHADSRFPRRASFATDGKGFINPNPNPDEVQPRWGNPNVNLSMW